MTAYYNEIDPFAAEWLRNLIAAGHIAPGDVDERSIEEVQADDIRGYTQCHFFAGIGLWSLSLRWSGWPDDRPVWSGSCPCQPLSGAGQRKGHADERHLWPAFHGLIAECGPPVVFGEQVASKDGREWFAAVRADLEADGYACGAADLCAAGVGAPHIRQRLFWVGHRCRKGLAERERDGRVQREAMEPQPGKAAECGGDVGGVADALGDERRQERADGSRRGEGSRAQGLDERSGDREPVRGLADAGFVRREVALQHAGSIGSSDAKRQANEFGSGGPSSCGLADADGRGSSPRREAAETARHGRSAVADGRDDHRPGPPHGFWRDADWLFCRDGKWRPAQPCVLGVVDGYSAGLARGGTIDARKILRDVRQASGGDEGLRAAALLFAAVLWQINPSEVAEHWEKDCAEAFSGENVPEMWIEGKSRSASSRRRPIKQLRSKHRGSVPSMSCGYTRYRWDLGEWAGTEEHMRYLWRVLRRQVAQTESEDLFPAMPERMGEPLCDETVVGRVGMLRAYGNAICPQVAAEFIGAVMEVLMGGGR